MSALRQWQAAPLVLVGEDLARAVADQAPPRRPDVHLLSQGEADYRTAVALGATDVVSLPEAETWLVETMADVGDGGARAAVTIGFIGGSGGVGATTLACAVAQLAGSRRPAALVDLDPLGPGAERVLGLDGGDAGVRWADLAGTHGRLGSRALRDSLPRRDGLSVLGFGTQVVSLDPVIAREVLAAAQRGHDVVVLDLPRHLGGAAEHLVTRCDHVVLVASCSLPGAAAAARSLDAVSVLAPTIHLAARTGRGTVRAERLAATLSLPLLAEVPTQRSVGEYVDLGVGPLHSRRGPLARAATEVLERLT